MTSIRSQVSIKSIWSVVREGIKLNDPFPKAGTRDLINECVYEETVETSKHQIISCPVELNNKFLEAYGWDNAVVDEDVVQQLLVVGADII